MPLSCSQSSDQPIITLRSSEPVGPDSLTLALDALLSDPRRPDGALILLDLTTLSGAHVPQAVTLAAHLARIPAARVTRFALLVPGMRLAVWERAFAMYLAHAGLTVRLFSDPTVARGWLLSAPADAQGVLAPG